MNRPVIKPRISPTWDTDAPDEVWLEWLRVKAQVQPIVNAENRRAKIRAAVKAHYWKHRADKLAYLRRYHELNKEKLNACSREYYYRKHALNKVKGRLNGRKQRTQERLNELNELTKIITNQAAIGS